MLALASSPSFDANALVVVTEADRDPAQAAFAALTSDPRAPLVQRATSGLYPPGSTFKTITAAAAIDTGVARPDTIYEDAGELTVAGHTLVEQNRPNDQQTQWSLTESLAWSLNVVFAQVGLQLGGDTLAEAARGWGWESDIPFDLPVEASRVSVTPGFLDDPVAVAETAFGQGELQATPLQMALVAAGIANDGEIMRPHLVASLAEPDGETVRETQPSRWRRGTGVRGRRSDRRHDGLCRRERRAGDGLRPGLHDRRQDRHRRNRQRRPARLVHRLHRAARGGTALRRGRSCSRRAEAAARSRSPSAATSSWRRWQDSFRVQPRCVNVSEGNDSTAPHVRWLPARAIAPSPAGCRDRQAAH